MGIFTGVIAAILAGDEIKDTDLDSWHDALIAETDPWTAYTPTLTNITLGNGTLFGAYRQVGKTVDFRLSVAFGTTTALTASAATVGLPVTALDSSWAPCVYLHDSSTTATRQGGAGNVSTTTIILLAAAGNIVTSGTPFTWAVGDIIRVSGTYEAA